MLAEEPAAASGAADTLDGTRRDLAFAARHILQPVPARDPIPADMFRLVRFFVLTSVATAAAIAIALFVYRLGEVQRLVAFAEQQNVELARSFANTIWPGLSPLLQWLVVPLAALWWAQRAPVAEPPQIGETA